MPSLARATRGDAARLKRRLDAMSLAELQAALREERVAAERAFLPALSMAEHRAAWQWAQAAVYALKVQVYERTYPL